MVVTPSFLQARPCADHHLSIDVDTQYTMDCADTTAFFVSSTVLDCSLPSMGVPKRGSAPDIKQGVLNSHVSIKNPLFPLASGDLERTITMEHEV